MANANSTVRINTSEQEPNPFAVNSAEIPREIIERLGRLARAANAQRKTQKAFYVGHDMRLPEGGTLIGAKLSGALHSRFQLKKALKRIRLQYPYARGIVSVSFC